MKDRIFKRADWICGAIAALLAFAGYAWTTAPSVTLLDSGEFIVAAQHFGVPHPTGYPLWTLLAWLFQLIPLGNVAWQLALFSGLCGALAVGLTTMLVRNSALWMLPAVGATAAGVCAISMGLVFAFSFSMWSQAVIVEVYTLHALLIGLYLASLYVWLRRPERLAGLYWSFFTLALAFSNHQLALVFAVVPLQFLVIILLRRDLFWDLFLALMVSALIAYLSFALLANDALVVKAAIRLGYLVVTILVIALVLKRGRLNWLLIACLPFVIALGMLPYAYMPIASATNPPMNWGYTKTADGFFYSFNRSQYPGTLSELSLRILSKVLGVGGGNGARKNTYIVENEPSEGSAFDGARDWTAFFTEQAVRSFSPVVLLFFVVAILGAFRRPPAARVWIYVLATAFLLAMGFQPVLERVRTDNAAWWVQMPYHTYTNLILALLCGLGACFVWHWLATRAPVLRHGVWAMLLLPLWPLWFNADGASQRDRWFGWQYGHDMLATLPKGSVIFGGTDPGRFVATYMIFGESMLPRSRRIDPEFDRRDLYIITQNGFGDRYYLDYIRDQYTTARPRVRTSFERWLQRDRTYPETPLILPTLAEMQQIRQDAADAIRKSGEPLKGADVGQRALAAVAKWIFEKNRAEHAFYVEESFVMPWSYDHAVPEGLLYRINPEPLAKLPDAAIRKDFAFWDGYIAKLASNPAYAKDYDAVRSFSRLRLTGASIYEHRGLLPEAEKAYRQTLELWTGSVDAITGLTRILWPRGEFDEIIALYERALKADPNSRAIRKAIEWAAFRKIAQTEIDTLLGQWRRAPQDIDAIERLAILYARINEGEKMDDLLREAIGKVGSNPKFLFLVVRISGTRWQQSADAAGRWVEVEPQSAEAHYRLARAQAALGESSRSVQTLATAVRLGGMAMRERVFADPIFQALKDTPEVQKLIAPPQPTDQSEP